MKIAAFNVDGISARLSVLLRRLAESKADIACLQEWKAPPEKFRKALFALSRLWRDLAWAV